jgi:hypothetical protein
MGPRSPARATFWSLRFRLALGCAILPLQGAGSPQTEVPYETPAALHASELLAPELREGPQHRVAELVETDGLLRIYQVETDFGRFEARGEDMLRARIREANALGALRDASQTSEFVAAEKRAGPSPFVSGRSVADGPIEMLGGRTPAGVAILPGSRGPGSPGGDFLGSLAAFRAARRDLAHGLGVDPYGDNAPLQQALDRHAWVMAAGGAPSPDLPGFAGAAFDSARADDLIRDYSAEDLERLNRIELAAMGVPEPLREEFIANPAYSPSHETVLVDALAALEGTEGREAFIEAAAQAQSGEQAQDYERMAELMRSYADHAGGLVRMERMAGGVAARAPDGTLLVPVCADHALWTRGMAKFAEALARQAAGGADAVKARLLFSGTVSPLAREQIERLGMSVAEDALDAQDAAADHAAEAPSRVSP